MRNYHDSDYAANKYSPNIVYRFADSTVEVTLEDYMKSNPDKTQQDFAELKALSDKIYHNQVVDENRTSRLDVTLTGLEETTQFFTVSLDTELINKFDTQNVVKAAKILLSSGVLTVVQARRFILHFYQGLSYRQIANYEGVHFTSVQESIEASKGKLKKIFEKI